MASHLSKQLASLIEGAEEFKAEHGSCEVVVAENSPIAKARIERVAGFKIDAATISFHNRKTNDSMPLGEHEVYFHKDDHPMFGSKAVEDDFDVDWGDE